MAKLTLDPKTKTHYAINLHEALCGSGWLQAAGSIEDITCQECKRLLTQRAADGLNMCRECGTSKKSLVGELCVDCYAARR